MPFSMPLTTYSSGLISAKWVLCPVTTMSKIATDLGPRKKSHACWAAKKFSASVQHGSTVSLGRPLYVASCGVQTGPAVLLTCLVLGQVPSRTEKNAPPPRREVLRSLQSIWRQSPSDLVSHASLAGGGAEGAFIFLAALSFKLDHTN